jgi:AcrR family transcriptional regulator
MIVKGGYEMATKEEEIIMATIACIEKYGIEGTTIRRIGMQAGVNSASINYYFRSKDALIQRVLDIALGNAFDFENFSGSEGFPPKKRLAHIMEGMIAGALQYPNLTKAFFSELLLKDNYASPMVQKCNAFLSEIERGLTAEYPDRDQTCIRMALMQVASSTFLFMGLFPRFFTAYPEIDLSDEKTRRAYVEGLVEKLF